MITCSMRARVSRARLVSIRNSDSGVVIRMSGGWRTRRRRSSADVSPVRTRRWARTRGTPSRSPAQPDSPQRSPKVLLHVHRQTPAAARCTAPECPRPGRPRVPPGHPTPATAPDPAGAPDMSRSMAHRNAASVLPVPVGAHTSAWSPAAMAGQPSDWGAVGAANVDVNQARVGSEKAARASATTPTPYRRPTTPADVAHSQPPTNDEPAGPVACIGPPSRSL